MPTSGEAARIPVMRLRSTYTLVGRPLDESEIELPIELSLNEGITAAIRAVDDKHLLVVEREVTGDKLERVDPEPGKQGPPGLRIQGDEPPERIILSELASAITFLADSPVTFGTRDKRFVPDTEEDQEMLDRFGTDRAHRETGLQVATRTFTAPVTADNISALLDKTTGLELYSAALKAGLAHAQFRDLWRVLESAFREKNEELVKLLAAYPPAVAMQFDEKELKALLVLRHRASHAYSRAGLTEVLRVERACGESLPRLKNLVERVVLTKAEWGDAGLDTDELTELLAYVGPDGTIYMKASEG
jgi:hypothetical protein